LLLCGPAAAPLWIFQRAARGDRAKPHRMGSAAIGGHGIVTVPTGGRNGAVKTLQNPRVADVTRSPDRLSSTEVSRAEVGDP
jgi:hypothetical protein